MNQNQTPKVTRINTAQELAAFAAKHGLRRDWHEPDETGIDARIIGTHLDNAMGPRHEPQVTPDGHDFTEFNVVLTLTPENTERADAKDVAVVNLATLLSFAAKAGRAAEGR